MGEVSVVEAAGFFVIRTPLLAFDEVVEVGPPAEAPNVQDDGEALDAAVRRDLDAQRRWLRGVVSRPEVRDAIFVGSPDLHERLEGWLASGEDASAEAKLERALMRYVVRMATRATPFGLFAGCTLGAVDGATRLVLDGRHADRARSRLDMGYLAGLCEALARDPECRAALAFRPNPTLYRVADRLRYVQVRAQAGRRRSHHLVAVDVTDALEIVLAAAGSGAHPADLADALAERAPAPQRAAYVDQLIDGQLLVADLPLLVTGPEAAGPLIDYLATLPAAAGIARALREVVADLAGIDAAPLGQRAGLYRSAARRLADGPVEAELPRLFQVDVVRAMTQATLAVSVVEDCLRAVGILRRLSARGEPAELRELRERLIDRYEGQAVPLLEALDEEGGVGYRVIAQRGGDAAPLLGGIGFPSQDDASVTWGPFEALLVRRLSKTLRAGVHELVLEEADLAELDGNVDGDDVDAFAVMATLAASSAQAADNGDYCLHVHGVSGPSGARLLGRFAHTDKALEAVIKDHLHAEEACRPEAVFAEIVHLPEGRVGNIIARPVLRSHEIALVGSSGAPPDRVLPASDLLLAVEGNEIVVRSQRLGRRVIPRLTTAHDFDTASLAAYRLLCLLQDPTGRGTFVWSWGPLASAPFTPRVRCGRIVLALARWRLTQRELRDLAQPTAAARFAAVRRLRSGRGLPRLVALQSGHDSLLFDLDSALSVETFVGEVRELAAATLVEAWPAPDDVLVRGPGGRYVHELILPFARRAPAPAVPSDAPPADAAGTQPQPRARVRRAFVPGSEWLFAKLYTGPATADRVLTEALAPLVRGALDVGAADRWHFIRYADPDMHVRLRFHGDPGRLTDEIRPQMERVAADLLDAGLVWRLTWDTYRPEVERYGGDDAIALAEQAFHADSDAVLDILSMLEPGDAGADERWRLALAGADALPSDYGLDRSQALELVGRIRRSFGAEFRFSGQAAKQLAGPFRRERARLAPLLDLAADDDHELAPGMAVLRERSRRLRPLGEQLAELERSGRLVCPLSSIVGSLIHMHVNRLLRSAHRQQELVLYDLLERLHIERAARARARPPR